MSNLADQKSVKLYPSNDSPSAFEFRVPGPLAEVVVETQEMYDELERNYKASVKALNDKFGRDHARLLSIQDRQEEVIEGSKVADDNLRQTRWGYVSPEVVDAKF